MHDDLNDSLDSLFSGQREAREAAPAKPFVPFEDRAATIAHRALFEESCKACRGSGRFRSWSGRDVGACFKCKGKGKLTFKTDNATREAAREAREARKARAVVEAHETYKANNPDAYAWMTGSAASFPFAQAMLDAITQWGALTEKQQAAVDKCIAARAKAQAERAERAASAPAVSADKLTAAFERVTRTTNRATDNDVGTVWRQPVLRLDTFHISPASKHPGTLYIKEGNVYCGKIVDGRFHRARECTEDQQTRIAAACADPDASARQYGLRYGVCSCCGRTLTNQESRELGIGPICRARWFAV